jgi:hypothetical protein
VLGCTFNHFHVPDVREQSADHRLDLSWECDEVLDDSFDFVFLRALMRGEDEELAGDGAEFRAKVLPSPKVCIPVGLLELVLLAGVLLLDVALNVVGDVSRRVDDDGFDFRVGNHFVDKGGKASVTVTRVYELVLLVYVNDLVLDVWDLVGVVDSEPAGCTAKVVVTVDDSGARELECEGGLTGTGRSLEKDTGV